jgi:endonuclease YncB( thermonuclease family)
MARVISTKIIEAPKPEGVAVALRRRRWWVWGGRFVLVLLGLSIYLDHRALPGGSGDDWATFNHRDAKVVGAVGADSVLVQLPGSDAKTPVRLIGVAGFDADWDSQAQRWLDANVSNRSITLLLGPTQTRDGQGDLLAYAFLPRDNISTDLVKSGLALADRREPYALHGAVEEAETDARKKRRGLWATATDRMMPAWRQQWLAGLRSKEPRSIRNAMGD